MSNSVVIVTKNQYILASKVHHVVMDEQVQFQDVIINGKDECVKNIWYQMTIVYSPFDVSTNQNNHSNSEDMRECSVIMRDIKDAHRVFRDVVRQIREQIPDQMYLNKALEQMLGNFKEDDLVEDHEGMAKDKILTKEEAANDRKSKRVRALRKAERGSKVVLRKTRRSHKKAVRRNGRK